MSEYGPCEYTPTMRGEHYLELREQAKVSTRIDVCAGCDEWTAGEKFPVVFDMLSEQDVCEECALYLANQYLPYYDEVMR